MPRTGRAAKAPLITDHRYVTVDGKQAAWLFSEFETDKSLTDLVDWLTPERWPQWGRPFFKKMERVTPEQHGPSRDEWQAKYLEVVDLLDGAGPELWTVLRCDFAKKADWAAMTYDLDQSMDDQLQVDRGFLLAVEAPGGKKRQVKALKVVGFTNPLQTLAAQTTGARWTTWIQEAIKLAADDVSEDQAKKPSVGHHGPGGSRMTADNAPDYYKDRANQWTDCVTDMAQFYSGYATDVGSRLYSGDYKPGDAAQDSGRLFLRLARDWSRLWRAGSEMAEAFADADISSSGGGDPTTDYTDVLVPARDEPTRVSLVGDPVKVGLEDTKLNRAHIEVDPKSVPKGPDPAVIRLKPHSRAGPSGLYAGDLEVEDKKHPAFVYISKARPVA
jgi:hypothetical protein